MFRLNKKLTYLLGIAGSIVLLVLTIGGAMWLTHTQSAVLGNARLRCQTHVQPKTYTMTIQDNGVAPAKLTAPICSRLVIRNDSAVERLMAFGPHERHISYDGVSEQLLPHGGQLAITLDQAGTYNFHDHEQPAINGTFSVTGLIPR